MAGTIKALETIDLLYQAALEPALWPEALDRMAKACGGIGTAMIPITPQDTTGLIVSPELREPNVEYEREWWRHDTRVLRIFSRKLNGGVCCEAELFTDEELARDPLRQEFLRSYGIGAFAAQLVVPFPDLVVAFSVQRRLKLGHFEARDLATLKLLGTHAARALLISMRLATARKIGQTIVHALAQFDCAAIVVDRDMKIVFANAASERLAGDGLSVKRGVLSASHRQQCGALKRFVLSVLQKNPDSGELGPIVLPRSGGRRPLLVQAVPIAAAPDDAGLPPAPAVLVIAVDPDQDGVFSAVKALRLLGLTPSEARLAELLGAGHSRAQTAELLGISQATVSDTTKQIYTKLGISRQSHLVRLVARLAALRTPAVTP